jgi:hypothetical protein
MRTALTVGDAKGQMSLFAEDTHFVVFMNAKDPKPSMDLHTRDALAPVFADLNKFTLPFGCCFPIRSFAPTTWQRPWWTSQSEEKANAKTRFSRTETFAL